MRWCGVILYRFMGLVTVMERGFAVRLQGSFWSRPPTSGLSDFRTFPLMLHFRVGVADIDVQYSSRTSCPQRRHQWPRPAPGPVCATDARVHGLEAAATCSTAPVDRVLEY
jgi:hypothetical protein